jgi:hypothetical protein
MATDHPTRVTYIKVKRFIKKLFTALPNDATHAWLTSGGGLVLGTAQDKEGQIEKATWQLEPGGTYIILRLQDEILPDASEYAHAGLVATFLNPGYTQPTRPEMPSARVTRTEQTPEKVDAKNPINPPP